MNRMERTLYTTVPVVALAGDRSIGRATGFIWFTPFTEQTQITCLITNRHVVEGADAIEVTFHERDTFDAELPNGRQLKERIDVSTSVIVHPDPTVDLAAVPISWLINRLMSQRKFVYVHALSMRAVPSPDEFATFGSVEDVLMVGYPSGIYDVVNNYPLVRRGITATSMARRFNGASEFMVDMACFPGSSGSPVIFRPGPTDGEGAPVALVRPMQFVGILYAGPVVTNTGIIRLGAQPQVEVSSMMHLGQVIRSSEMAALEQQITVTLTGQREA